MRNGAEARLLPSSDVPQHFYQDTGLLIPYCRRRGQTHLAPEQEAQTTIHRRP